MTGFVFWLVFAGTFLALGVIHWRKRNETLPEITNTFHIAAINGVRLGAGEFVEGVNGFVRRLNLQVAQTNRITAVGYWAASATAALSALLSLLT